MGRRPILARQVATTAAALVVAGLSGCSDDPSREHAADQSVVIALNEDSEFWPAAIVTGRLIEQDDCLLIDEAVAVFPIGTTWEGPTVRFKDGQTVGVGNRVRMGGGWFEVDQLTQEGLPAVPARGGPGVCSSDGCDPLCMGATVIVGVAARKCRTVRALVPS